MLAAAQSAGEESPATCSGTGGQVIPTAPPRSAPTFTHRRPVTAQQPPPSNPTTPAHSCLVQSSQPEPNPARRLIPVQPWPLRTNPNLLASTFPPDACPHHSQSLASTCPIITVRNSTDRHANTHRSTAHQLDTPRPLQSVQPAPDRRSSRQARPVPTAPTTRHVTTPAPLTSTNLAKPNQHCAYRQP